MKELVYLDDGKGKTDSLVVANEFGKEHHMVLRKIQDCFTRLPVEFTDRNFAVSSYTDSTGRELPKYELTRDGFMFLVMGFTGKKADATKLLFIEEFNRMETKLVNAGLQHQELTINDMLKMVANKLQDAVNYAVDFADEHTLTAGAVIKRHPVASKLLIEATKPHIRNLAKYTTTGILTIGLQRNGIKTNLCKLTNRGPAKVFNTKEVDDFMKSYSEAK